ncbi:sulfotransferase domain-containing protein [Burkholderia sp. Se-20378]|uniref:sulfotransferase domain-containing protein n=1 Tax=Burkholderia sp. Se-20378 TaxID=2703899 RepID=UPI0019803DE7|nr:sulfotransferase domain-containing protein [Burkholderia sp. Se-20378]MBN3769179.1 methyltransferase domain-containing protein [Burkholderia sp. Se-20378]
MRIFKPAPPTVFHITHWKAGSQWILKILQQLQPDRIVPPKVGERQFFIDPLITGKIYPTTYVTKEQFLLRKPPSNSRALVVLRDLRDTLVSSYFSARYSHAVMSNELGTIRSALNELSEEDGLILLAEKWLPASALIHASWLQSDQKIVWYEDLLANDVEILGDALLRDCRIDVPASLVRQAIVDNRFENLSAGRARGSEAIYDHERKGIAGDWENHFTARVSARFDELYGPLLDRVGAKKRAEVSVRAKSGATVGESEIIAAYDELIALYPNVPSYVLWLAWEYAAYRKIRVSGQVLDVGCADGRLANLILTGAADIKGLAPDPATAEVAALYGPYSQVWEHGRLAELPAGAEFDVIFVRGALVQAHDLGRTLQDLRGRLKKNGRLICSVLTDNFSRDIGVSAVMNLCGFHGEAQVADARYRGGHDIVNAKPLGRWREDFSSAGFAVEQEISIVPAMTLHSFALLDSLWHTPRGETGKLGDTMAARIAAIPSFAEGFRSIVRGLVKLDEDSGAHAAAVMMLSRVA